MVVKRPVPYVDQQKTFKNSAVVRPGELVVLASTGTISAGAGGTANHIGVVLYDHGIVADKGTDTYAAGTVVPVHLRSIPMKALAANTITAGSFVKLGSSTGTVAAEAKSTVRTLNTIGIALNGGVTNAEIAFVPM